MTRSKIILKEELETDSDDEEEFLAHVRGKTTTIVKSEWATLYWSSQNVRLILASSYDTIKLESEDKHIVTIHKELLSHFSPYYKRAFREGKSKSSPRTSKIEAKRKMLEHLFSWLYSGMLSPDRPLKRKRAHHQGGRQSTPCGFSDLVALYTLADAYNFPALRRWCLSELSKIGYRSDLLAQDFNRTINSLSKKSALRAWFVERYINHSCEDASAEDKETLAGLDHDFLLEVIMGQSYLVHCLQYSRKKACCCCHDLCPFHQHENERERLTTCGKNGVPDFRLRLEVEAAYFDRK